MPRLPKQFALGLFCLGLAACATLPASAPQPAKPVAASFFTGRWYEIARTPTSFTNNCVAGTTDFFTTSYGQLTERDECRIGSPEGKIRTFQGATIIVNPGDNSEFQVHYVFYGVLPIEATYLVLDHADDYSWFIVANPSFHNLDILGRAPRQTPAQVAALTSRARQLGYDTSKLEFPETFPPGEQ